MAAPAMERGQAAPRVLVVDDKPNMRRLCERILDKEFLVVTAEDGTDALERIATDAFDVVVTDVRMPGASGFEVLRAARQSARSPEVVLLTAYGNVEDAVAAMKDGAFDYLQKPFDPDALSQVVRQAAERRRVRAAPATTMRAPSGPGFGRLVGRSQAMLEVYDALRKASELEITVLLQGETGTGKELAARAIHDHSARAGRPFVAVNCGALPAELVESELFGHAKGAFTGASVAKVGLFEEAAGGTLFLDEVGELPALVQVKLNRALQEREVRRVGANRAVRVDVRVIAASHRDLRAEAAAGRFREDLFYRLNVFPIELPPLRARTGDVPDLAAFFLARYSAEHGRPVAGFDPDALLTLMTYGWPGNVRELENAVERAIAVADGPTIGVAGLPLELTSTPDNGRADEVVQLSFKEAVDAGRRRVGRDYLVALMRAFQGNVTRAAEQAGMERESLHRILRRYGVKPRDFRP